MGHHSELNWPGEVYVSGDNAWGDGQQYLAGAATTSTNGQTAAVDAHYGAQVTWDFFQQVLGRNGIDGKGTPTRLRVHYSTNYDNAFWWDECFCLTFGDGSKFKTLTPLDVVAHEFSHGVTFSTAGLIYSGESGGLNEATSDIFGTMVEFYARGAAAQGTVIPATGGNWTLGEQMQTAAFDHPLRYMHKPSLDGSSPDAWSAALASLDVHYSSGPMNRCFYFLSQGASPVATSVSYSPYLSEGMAGIGNDKAARIWYRALTTYLTSASNYLHARMASLRAARDLYGATSAEFQAVRDAFAAINVGYSSGSGDDLEPPTLAASVTGTTGTVEFAASAQDNNGLATLVFYVDQRRVGTGYGASQKSATVRWPFESQSLPKGDHILTVSATDTAGNIAYSAPVSFHLSNAFYELLLQGDFELGSAFDGGIDKRNMAWVDPDGTICQGFSYLGWWCADICGLGDTNTQSIYQTVTIPAQAQHAILSFWLQVYSQEPDDKPRDIFRVLARSTSGELLGTLATFSNLDRSRLDIPIPAKKDYVQHFIDLTSYRGKTIQLWFEGQEDAAHTTYGVASALVGREGRTPGLVQRPALSQTLKVTSPEHPRQSFPNGTGISEFFLDNVSLRIAEAEDTDPPVAAAKSVRESYGELELQAEARDNLVIQRVEYLVDGSSVGATTAGPHHLFFDSRALPNGPHTFAARATDLAGNQSTSSGVTFATDNTFSQLLKNPGFESGRTEWDFNNWGLAWYGSINDTEVDTRAQNQMVYGATLPATLSQAVSIPADAKAAKLRFSYLFMSMSNPPDDTLKVQVRDANGTVKSTLATFAPPATGQDFGTAEVDLSAYRGQSFLLTLAMNSMSLSESGVRKGMLVSLSGVQLVIERPTNLTFIEQPLSQTIPLGDPVTFSVQATGASPLSYQWRRNQVALAGATGASYRLPNVQAADAGRYDVQISNSLGQATSNQAVLTVNAPPIITTHPASQSQSQGGTATFAVVATGSGTLSFQWIKGGSSISGATSASYSMGNLQASDEASYACVVTNSLNGTATCTTSRGATLTLRTSITVTASPRSVTLLAGEHALLSATVSGTPDALVTWSIASGGGVLLAGAAGSVTYTAPASAGTATITATSHADPTKSDSVTLTVRARDLSGDGITDVLDLARIARAFGATANSPHWNPAADLNGDGIVDHLDLTLFLTGL